MRIRFARRPPLFRGEKSTKLSLISADKPLDCAVFSRTTPAGRGGRAGHAPVCAGSARWRSTFGNGEERSRTGARDRTFPACKGRSDDLHRLRMSGRSRTSCAKPDPRSLARAMRGALVEQAPRPLFNPPKRGLFDAARPSLRCPAGSSGRAAGTPRAFGPTRHRAVFRSR
jgi:hypothetical protein